MTALFLGMVAAFWLGVVTSVSPCPLASNIAAMSYVSRGVGSSRRVLLTGALYSLGRALAYALVAGAIVGGLSSVPSISFFLQKHMNRFVGPVLIAAGVLLLDWIRIPWFRGSGGAGAEAIAKKGGLLGGLLLGAFLALAFCPVSAALFFGGLVPLSLEHRSAVLLPTIYGIGTALPVVVFAFLLAAGVSWLGRVYDRMLAVERWARKITAVVMLVVGWYYLLGYTLPAIGLGGLLQGCPLCRWLFGTGA